MPLVILSKVDPVSKTMISLNPPFEFKIEEKDTINLWDLDKKYNTDLFIIVSRHESLSKIPVYSAHFTGELDKGLIGYTYPSFHKNFLLKISKLNPEYQVSTEPMHHGPILSKPVMFVEIGSSEKEWENKDSVNKLMKAVEETIKDKKRWTSAIGVGGGHYSKKFTNIILNSKYAIGPLISKYYSKYLNEKVFKELIEKSVEKIETVLIDKKCKIKNEVINWSQRLGLKWIKI